MVFDEFMFNPQGLSSANPISPEDNSLLTPHHEYDTPNIRDDSLWVNHGIGTFTGKEIGQDVVFVDLYKCWKPFNSTVGRDGIPSVTSLLMMSPRIWHSADQLSSSSIATSRITSPSLTLFPELPLPCMAWPTRGVTSRYLGVNRRERRKSFSSIAIDDVTPHMAFCRQIVVVVHRYFKNHVSLPNVIPGAAAPTHGVVSHDLGLNRRERRKSFSSLALNDAVILQQTSILNVVRDWPKSTSFHHVDLSEASQTQQKEDGRTIIVVQFILFSTAIKWRE
jgi:hypothetical protein